MTEPYTTYRNYIDGLRAIAVVAVFIFHLVPEVFPGGYLGVDVFFVISGFVITQSLYKSYKESGRIDIWNFYRKRFKRLYPALLVMLLVTSVLYFLIGFLWDTNLFIKSAISSIFAISNLYFLKRGDDYFAENLINPLLHTWSLGVEEQFYFIYPVALLTLLLFVERSKKRIDILMWALVIFSACLYAIFAFGSHDIFSNFYFPTARFWELGAGCALFFLIARNRNVVQIPHIAWIAYISLFGVLLTQSVIADVHIETLVVVLSTAGIIFVGCTSPLHPAIKFLEVKSMTFIGKLSYSLYLWHLPTIYFASLYFDGLVFVLVSTCASFLCAYISYNYVEVPLRHSDYLDGKIKYIFLVLFGCLILGLVLVANNKLPQLNSFLNSLDTKLSTLNYIESNFRLGERIKPDYISKVNTESCISSIENTLLLEDCLKRGGDDRNLFVLSGDSHALHFVPMVDASKEITNINYTDSLALKSAIVSDSSADTFAQEVVKINLSAEEYEQVYFGLSLFLTPYANDSFDIERKLDLYLEQIDPRVHIILFEQTPVFPTSPESCVVTKQFCYRDDTSYRESATLISKVFENLRKKYKNLSIYNPNSAICPTDVCVIYDHDKDFLLYRDDDHLSIEASRSLAPHFDQWFSAEFLGR